MPPGVKSGMEESVGSAGPQTIQKEIRSMLLHAHFSSLLPTEQSGFRKQHSTNDKLFEPTQAVCQAQRLSSAWAHYF